MNFEDRPVKLGVNIDHWATLRQARRDVEPDPIAAAKLARQAGADMIVAHLRRDRRHIQDKDLFELCRLRGKTHVEVCADPAMLAVVTKAKPFSVCLVPERPGEVSTEGGLRLADGAEKAAGRAIERLKKSGMSVSLFIDPEASAVRSAKSLGADTVELCTTAYAESKGGREGKTALEKIDLAAYLAHELGLRVHAGHGLDYENVRAVAGIAHLEAVNIGFSIVSRSVFVGINAAVAEMKKLLA
jgi:pyridoxine 5-phosphate synthase